MLSFGDCSSSPGKSELENLIRLMNWNARECETKILPPWPLVMPRGFEIVKSADFTWVERVWSETVMHSIETIWKATRSLSAEVEAVEIPCPQDDSRRYAVPLVDTSLVRSTRKTSDINRPSRPAFGATNGLRMTLCSPHHQSVLGEMRDGVRRHQAASIGWNQFRLRKADLTL